MMETNEVVIAKQDKIISLHLLFVLLLPLNLGCQGNLAHPTQMLLIYKAAHAYIITHIFSNGTFRACRTL